MRRRHVLLVGFVLLFATATWAQDDGGFLQRLGLKKSSTALPETKIADGLKEALTVGIDRTIVLVGKDDGYFTNKNIKIPLPKTVERVAGPLRAAGYGPQMDEFVLSMNRAAEQAAPLAKDIFVKAITEMTIDDARGILKGSDTAATDYLNEHTRERLTEAFLPHVRQTMAQYQVMEKYNAFAKQASGLPFVSGLADGNVEKYTVGKALDGLFYMVGQEEKRIRQDPAARATDLLKTVFK